MNSNKKELFISTIVIFLLGFIVHNLFEWFPGYITSIIAPVNESIWEHMKLFFTGTIIFEMIRGFIFKRKYKNRLLAMVISITSMILIFLPIYYPIYLAVGDNMFITLVLFFLAILAGQYIYLRVTSNVSKDYSTTALVALFLMIYMFISFTYEPSHLEIFTENQYKIKK